MSACSAATATKYQGPVPMVVHVHGAEGVQDSSDGYTEAWYMPAANNLAGYAAVSFHCLKACQKRMSFRLC
jgi:hypothetical protein